MPTSSTNTPELEGRTPKLQQEKKVAEYDIYVIASQTALFYQIDEINATEISNNGTTLAKNHRDNGALPLHCTKTSLLESPLLDSLVSTDEIPPHTHVEDGGPARLSITIDLPEVLLKGSYKALYKVYQDWVHQNPVNNLDGKIKEDGKW